MARFHLPRPQRTRSPLLASVVVGLGWAAWHLPLQLRGAGTGARRAGLGSVLAGFANQVSVSVVFTWLFNRSGGSLLGVVA